MTEREQLVREQAIEAVAQIEMDREGHPLSRTLEEVYTDAAETVDAVLEIAAAALNATQPTEAEVREVIEAARENPDARAYTNAQVATLLERLSPAAVRREALEEAAKIAEGYDTFDRDTALSARGAAVSCDVAAAIRQHKDSDHG